MTKKNGLMLSLFFLIWVQSFAQTGLNIASGATINMAAGSTLSLDSLVLQPTSAFTLGPTTQARNSTVTYANSNPTVKRAYHFSPALTAFSGNITFYYQDAELNNIIENSLVLNIHNGTAWNVINSNVTRDPVNNSVATTGLSNTSLNELTLSGTLAAITFSGKVFLQGAYNTSAGTMNNTLNTSGILQANASSHPYNPVFNYTRTEGVSATFFASHTDIVDWVLIELRNATTPATVVDRRAAFVKQDGTLVETDGTNTQVSFTGITPGNYYVAIRHRNHLGIRSASPVNFSGGNASYDFTTSASQSFQNQSYSSTVQTGSVWSMRAGNANSNDNVKYNGPGNDQNQILNIKLVGSLSTIMDNVYSSEDINMNGNVKWNGPGNDQNYLLNTLLGGSLSIVFVEQLF